MSLRTNQVIQGDCREVMTSFPDDSVDLVVTSPPYWGLRDYGEETQSIWGGDPDCEHEWVYDNRVTESNFCKLCGAWRGQLGLEPHPQMYIDHLAEVGREIKRVLKPTGSFWLNLGDTYHSGGRPGKTSSRGNNKRSDNRVVNPDNTPNRLLRNDGGWLQPKQLLGIPWRVAASLQKDGWILRNCVVWHKPNHMPESVKDRLTKSYEFFFFFVKQPRYYFNLDEIREPYSEVLIARIMQPGLLAQTGGKKQLNPQQGAHQGEGNSNRPARIVKGRRTKIEQAIERHPQASYHDSLHIKPNNIKGKTPEDVISGSKYLKQNHPHSIRIKGGHTGDYTHPKGKNPGDFWCIPTTPFPGAHFAVFPPNLIEPIVKAGCPEGGVVLDPFAGSGTALRVARKLGRRFIGIEINPEYAAMCERRVRSDSYFDPPESVELLTTYTKEAEA